MNTSSKDTILKRGSDLASLPLGVPVRRLVKALHAFYLHRRIGFLTSLVADVSEIAGPIIQWSAAREQVHS
jgi:hypothetical protein